MKKETLHKLLGATQLITKDLPLVVIGSQSFYASCNHVPDAVVSSAEVDITFILSGDDRADQKAVDILNYISYILGEGSSYAHHNGAYVDVVLPGTAILPYDWKENLITYSFTLDNETCHSFLVLDPCDAAISKLMRLEDKDKVTVSSLIKEKILDVHVLQGLVEGELEYSASYSSNIDLARKRALSFLDII